MKLNRLLSLAASLSLFSSLAHAGETVTLTDVAGREVTLEVPVKHMILGEGRFLPSIGILDPENPVRWIAGMMGEFKALGSGIFCAISRKVPGNRRYPPGRQAERGYIFR